MTILWRTRPGRLHSQVLTCIGYLDGHVANGGLVLVLADYVAFLLGAFSTASRGPFLHCFPRPTRHLTFSQQNVVGGAQALPGLASLPAGRRGRVTMSNLPAGPRWAGANMELAGQGVPPPQAWGRLDTTAVRPRCNPLRPRAVDSNADSNPARNGPKCWRFPAGSSPRPCPGSPGTGRMAYPSPRTWALLLPVPPCPSLACLLLAFLFSCVPVFRLPVCQGQRYGAAVG